MKVKTNVVKWNANGVVYRRAGKIECYYLSTKKTNGKFNINTKPMNKTRLFDGPDCYTWRKTFALWPVKTIKGKYVWLRTVYKQRYWAVWGTGFHMEPEVEYAELFDILTNA
jgi:hypothetical protein